MRATLGGLLAVPWGIPADPQRPNAAPVRYTSAASCHLRLHFSFHLRAGLPAQSASPASPAQRPYQDASQPVRWPNISSVASLTSPVFAS